MKGELPTPKSARLVKLFFQTGGVVMLCGLASLVIGNVALALAGVAVLTFIWGCFAGPPRANG